MSKPYRPSNGTEGMIFESKFCNNCKNYLDEFDELKCPIWLNAGLFDIGDDDYPVELIYEDENNIYSGTCTAFERIDNGKD